MPSSATITAFHTFVANTRARAAYVNDNFDVFRGHVLPVSPSTATATDNTYDLGTDPWRWRTAYTNNVDFETSTSTSSLILTGDTSATLGSFLFKVNGSTVAQIDREGSSITPTGVILAYGGTSAPTGFLLCDGSSVSRTTYARLYAVIGTAFGTATTTSFNIPDFRGRFLRGKDTGAGRDPNAATRTAMNTGGSTGDTVGSIQADATKKNGLSITDPGHTHSRYYNSDTLNDGALNTVVSGNNYNTSSNQGPLTNISNTTGISIGAGDSETRPLNANVNYIIKT